MCSSDECLSCCCNSKTGTICIALWNMLIWVLTTIGLLYYGYTREKEKLNWFPDKDATRNLLFMGSAITFFLSCMSIMLLWAAIKKRPRYLRIWIIVNAVVEVILFTLRHVVTPHSWLIGDNISRTVVEIIFMRVVYMYEQSIRRINVRPNASYEDGDFEEVNAWSLNKTSSTHVV